MKGFEFALISFLFFSNGSLFSRWYCENVGAEKSGRVFRSCGIGEGKTEADARAISRKNAQKEFDFFCEKSSDCKNYKKNQLSVNFVDFHWPLSPTVKQISIWFLYLFEPVCMFLRFTNFQIFQTILCGFTIENLNTFIFRRKL